MAWPNRQDRVRCKASSPRPAGAEQLLTGEGQRIGRHHFPQVSQCTRCSRTGNCRRTFSNRSRSNSASTTPGPWQAVEDRAPRVDDQTVAVGFAAVGVPAALGGGDHVALIFDGAPAAAFPSAPIQWRR